MQSKYFNFLRLLVTIRKLKKLLNSSNESKDVYFPKYKIYMDSSHFLHFRTFLSEPFFQLNLTHYRKLHSETYHSIKLCIGSRNSLT